MADIAFRHTFRDVLALLHPYYLLNIVLSASFFILKTLPPFCLWLYDGQCELDWREWEITMFVAIVVIFKTRKAGATTMLTYLSSAFMYLKIGNVILYFAVDPWLCIVYCVLCVIHLLVFPEPAYAGPENIIYFKGPNLNEELNKDKRVIWLIAFYAAWSPACASFAPIFAELSSEYSLENLKFGKLDVTRYPQVAKEFYVNDSALSKQLPTVALFRSGKEVRRRPLVENKGRLQKFFFTVENLKVAFDMDDLYLECKASLSKKKSPVKSPTSKASNSHQKSE